MRIIFPVELRFNKNDYKHTLAVVWRFDKPIDLCYNIKAFIGENSEEMLDLLKADIIRQYSNIFETVSPKDFTLVYSEEKVENGRVWMGGCTIQMTCLG
jgi:hypothetical protein